LVDTGRDFRQYLWSRSVWLAVNAYRWGKSFAAGLNGLLFGIVKNFGLKVKYVRTCAGNAGSGPLSAWCGCAELTWKTIK